jgi:hypothetical protein
MLCNTVLDEICKCLDEIVNGEYKGVKKVEIDLSGEDLGSIKELLSEIKTYIKNIRKLDVVYDAYAEISNDGWCELHSSIVIKIEPDKHTKYVATVMYDLLFNEASSIEIRSDVNV